MKTKDKLRELTERRAKEKELAKLEKANGEPTTEKQKPAVIKRKRKVNKNFKINVKGE